MVVDGRRSNTSTIVGSAADLAVTCSGYDRHVYVRLPERNSGTNVGSPAACWFTNFARICSLTIESICRILSGRLGNTRIWTASLFEAIRFIAASTTTKPGLAELVCTSLPYAKARTRLG